MHGHTSGFKAGSSDQTDAETGERREDGGGNSSGSRTEILPAGRQGMKGEVQGEKHREERASAEAAPGVGHLQGMRLGVVVGHSAAFHGGAAPTAGFVLRSGSSEHAALARGDCLSQRGKQKSDGTSQGYAQSHGLHRDMNTLKSGRKQVW